MNIRQKILGSFMVVIVLLGISIGSVFVFHISTIKDYKRISDTLILENTLTSSVSEYVEAYNALAVAPQSDERIAVYTQKYSAILNTFSQLDLVVVDPDSKIAYQGLKNIILNIMGDLENGKNALVKGDVVTSSTEYNESVEKRQFVEPNVTLLVLKELQHLDRVQQDIERTYFFELVVVTVWTLLVVLLVIAYSFIFSEKLTFPIKELFLATEKVSQGDYHLRIPPKLLVMKDEVGSLATSFSVMLEKLNSKIDLAEQSRALVTEAKSHLEDRNADLERAQMATANLLEDLEEEKQAVEKKILERTLDLQKEKEKLLQVTENMKGGGILLDENSNIVFNNDAAYQALIPEKDANSRALTLNDLFEYFGNTEIKEYLEKCLSGESFHVPEMTGGGRVYEIFFHCLQSSNKGAQVLSKEVVGYFILFIDITDAKLLERSKSELVAVASHQLRTPLTAMRGNVEMLVDESYGPLNKEQHELLDDVEVSTIRLITMVNEMLDITKIEKGDLEMTIEPLNVKEILDSVTKDLDTYSKRHEFEILLSGVDKDIAIKGDKLRVRQVFQNLIDNAIKYSSHPGLLEIATARKGEMVEVTFKDNGIGVPKNEQSKLFGRFYRASNTAKTASSGSGLGLYIVKSIAKQLGGDIQFESEEGKGTTFFVTLPADDTSKHS